jgi:hypothetical protein
VKRICILPAIAACLLLAACPGGTKTIRMVIRDDGAAIGSVTLTGNSKATEFVFNLIGANPMSEYQAFLFGGKGDSTSASIALLGKGMTDAKGALTLRGKILFHGAEDVGIRSIADNDHTILIVNPDGGKRIRMIVGKK